MARRTQAPVTATFTPTGQQVFSYLNTANPISFKNAPGPPSPRTRARRLSTHHGGFAVAGGGRHQYLGIHLHRAARLAELDAFPADNNPELTHTLLLGYGIVNWVTKGVFLGERKIYMTAQPDDVFIPDDLWNREQDSDDGHGNRRYWRNTGTGLRQPGGLADSLSERTSQLGRIQAGDAVQWCRLQHDRSRPTLESGAVDGHAVGGRARQSECVPLDQPHLGPYLAESTTRRIRVS